MPTDLTLPLMSKAGVPITPYLHAELSSLRAVKKEEAEKLVAAGIVTLSDLAFCEIDKVAKKTGIDVDRISAMMTAALKRV